MNILKKAYNKAMEDSTNSLTTREKIAIWICLLIGFAAAVTGLAIGITELATDKLTPILILITNSLIFLLLAKR